MRYPTKQNTAQLSDRQIIMQIGIHQERAHRAITNKIKHQQYKCADILVGILLDRNS